MMDRGEERQDRKEGVCTRGLVGCGSVGGKLMSSKTSLEHGKCNVKGESMNNGRSQERNKCMRLIIRILIQIHTFVDNKCFNDWCFFRHL